MKRATLADLRAAEEHVSGMLPLNTEGEIWCVLDAVANEEDPMDNLEEYRHWRSPAGRRQEASEAWDSGRY
jgi:hypothetical protein